jgi:hypothetical protein
MGLLAVKPWEETTTFHFLYHMNIIIQTHFNLQMCGKREAINTSEWRFGVLAQMMTSYDGVIR